jgi:hypothetical protein
MAYLPEFLINTAKGFRDDSLTCPNARKTRSDLPKRCDGR